MNWGKKIEPISKKLVIVFMILTFVNILLPDEFIIGIETLQYRLDPFQMIIRWFNFVSFLAVPIAIFYNKPTFNKIAVYFCLPVMIIYTCMFNDILPGLTSELGTGIVDIRYLPTFVSSFMRNAIFRSVLFFAINILELICILTITLKDPKALKFNKKQILPFIILLVCLIVSILPSYALEGIFNTDSNIKFTFLSPAQIIWMVFMMRLNRAVCL